MDGQVITVCFTNGNGKDFSYFMFRGSSWQGDFFRGTKELHDLNHNFAVSNVVVEDRVKGSFTMAVYSEACTQDDI